MSGGNFDSKLNIVSGGKGVDAHGPLDPGDTVREMCVWIFQRAIDAKDEAAAVNMGGGFTGTWSLQVESPGGNATFEPGPAVAYAIALIDAEGKDEARVWSQPVELIGSGGSATRAAE